MTALGERERRRQVARAVEGLREAALGAGVDLPLGYAEQVCDDGLVRGNGDRRAMSSSATE